MKTTMKEMAGAVNCMASYQFGKLKLSTEKGRSYYKAIAAKKVVKTFLKLPEEDRLKFILKGLHELLESLLPEEVFPRLTRKLEMEDLEFKLKRYLYWLKQVDATYVGNGTSRDFKISGSTTLIEVTCDYFVEINGVITAITLKSNKPHLSRQGRKVETIMGSSFELYLMTKLCKEVYPNEVCSAAFHHLKQRGTKEGLPYGNEFISEASFSSLDTSFTAIIEGNMKTIIDAMEKGDTTCNPSACMNCSYKAICQYEKKEKMELELLEPLKKASDVFNLTSQQRKAVLFNEGIVRVNAGAGSGKTTIVALRVSELILTGSNPEDILLITFTNKGAGEMREKLKFWLGREGIADEAEKIHIETFNSWGGKIIKRHFSEMGFTAAPKLIDKVEKYDIIFKLLEEAPTMEGLNYSYPLMNFPKSKGVVVYVSEVFDYIKSVGSSDLKVKYPENTNALLDLYNKFNELLKAENLMEYQDQIGLVNDCINNAERFLDIYDYEHVIVDEFQDSDVGQLDLILHLSNQPKFKSLMIVGDDSQSIYGFRNTSQENILNFGKYFADMEDIKLTENFRSVPEILNLANHINSLNKNRIRKDLTSMAPAYKKLPEMHWVNGDKSKEEEVELIAQSIKKDLASGWNPEDIAVIARTRNELFEVQKLLTTLGIPSKLDVPEPLLKNPLLLPLRAILSSINDPELTFGMAAYLSIKDGLITDRDEKEVLHEIETLKKRLQELSEADDDAGTLRKEKFFEMMDEIKDEELGMFLEDIKEQGFSFSEMKTFIDKFVDYEDDKVYINPSEVPARAVSLITVHASKGKEYNVVYLSLSKFKSLTGEKESEEERRTLFVGVTRAKKRLFISVAVPNTKKVECFLAQEVSDSGYTENFNY